MLRSAILIFLLAFAVTAGAQEFGYNYLQASYGTVSFDDSIVDVDGDGLGISGSYGFHPDFYVAGEYQTADMDFGVDLNILELAVGYHTPLSDQLDFTAQTDGRRRTERRYRLHRLRSGRWRNARNRGLPVFVNRNLDGRRRSKLLG
jgi:hypothetical protein